MKNTSLSDVLTDLKSKLSNEFNVSIPALIEKYDFKTQKANVRINIKPYQNIDIDYPVLPNIPVVFPSSGGASLTMPVKKGDGCLLVFCNLDIKNWLLGGDNIKASTARKHHLSDAVAIIGLNQFSKQSNAENNDDLLISYSGSKIRLKNGGIIDIHNAKELNIQTENVVINCKNATISASDNASIECATASIKASSDVSVECNNATIKTAANTNIECATASVKATSAINSESPLFTQNGNMKVNGNIEITGVSLLTGKLTTQNGVENSGANLVSNGKVFETHTHTYQDVTEVIIPEGTAALIKTPTNSGQTQ